VIRGIKIQLNREMNCSFPKFSDFVKESFCLFYSMNNTLWLDPLVELIELSAAQTIGRKMNVRMELLKNGFAVDNPKVCELKLIMYW
jgi:hypothetical protein